MGGDYCTGCGTPAEQPSHRVLHGRAAAWDPGPCALQVDQLVFRHLVDTGFPRLAAHLDALGAHVAGVATQWFLCLFVNSLPLETCLRVWDAFFFERCASVLFRVGLALVDTHAQVPPPRGGPHPLAYAAHAQCNQVAKVTISLQAAPWSISQQADGTARLGEQPVGQVSPG